jgi:hypothetical protein
MLLQILNDGIMYLIVPIKSSPQIIVYGIILNAKMTMPPIPDPRKWR